VSNNPQINDKTDRTQHEVTPNKVKRINGPEVEKTKQEKESEANELYLNVSFYLIVFIDFINCINYYLLVFDSMSTSYECCQE
jgi:hypothetical protein